MCCDRGRELGSSVAFLGGDTCSRGWMCQVLEDLPSSATGEGGRQCKSLLAGGDPAKPREEGDG